ncbi:MAG: GntR family transcriptional regulator [Steroidobacteraceae bacterium]
MASARRPQLVRHSPTRDVELTSRGGNNGVARYYSLYELLSTALEDGTIAPGNALPSEPELCVRHDISRTTVRRALARLEHEGRIVRRRGSGTFARSQRAPLRFCVDLHALPETLAALESRTTAATLRFGQAPVPAVLRAMTAEIGATAYLLERLRSKQGEPLSLTKTYLPEPIGRRIRRPIPSRVSVLTIVGRLGPPTVAVRCSMGAVPADADAVRALEVPLGSPLLRVRAVLTGEAGELRAVLESLCRSDRVQLKIREPQHA